MKKLILLTAICSFPLTAFASTEGCVNYKANWKFAPSSECSIASGNGVGGEYHKPVDKCQHEPKAA